MLAASGVILGIIYGAVLPHPPIALPEIGGPRISEIAETVQAMQEVGRQIAVLNPDVVIVFTPHGAINYQKINIYQADRFSGSFANFGLPGLKMSFPGNASFSREILEELSKGKVPVQGLKASELDHGAMVPLYYAREAGYSGAVLPMTIAVLPLPELFKFGQALRQAIEQSGKRVVVIGSADMSHRLTKEAPNGFSPEGKKFDLKLVELMKKLDVNGILHFNEELAEAAAQDSLWSIAMLLGSLDGLDYNYRVLSYQGPFGVGYMVADFKVKGGGAVAGKDPLVALARETIETFIRKSRILKTPTELPAEMERRAGVFVSLHNSRGELRGCIGTFAPTKENIAAEIIANAISAATQDPRFPPVRKEELAELDISVDVLSEPEEVASIKQLDAKKYGVIVQAGFRRGLLLPDLDGVNTPEEQIEICRQKGGIGAKEPVKLYRFTVKRHH